MISLSETWIIFAACKIFEWVNQINCVREENVIVNEYLLFFSFIRIQWHQVTINNCLSSFDSSFQEIIIDFHDCSVSLDSIHKSFLWEIFDNLKLLIPIPNSFWI